jgi:3-methyl-2-oxobutanoate hydroxymethyltransferase
MSSYPLHPLSKLSNDRKKTTIKSIHQLFKKKIPISVMTAHDYPSGYFCEKAEIDICLVGDSLAMVALGYESTNSITLTVYNKFNF